MKMRHDHKKVFGVTTIGEKGQVVIPAEARKALGLERGDKLIVFGMGHGMLSFAKLSNIEQLASQLSKKLGMIRDIIEKNK